MKKIRIYSLLVAFSVAMSCVSSAVAQSDSANLVSAIEKMETLEQVVFSGTAETPESDDAGAMGGVQVIMAGEGQQGKVFNGRFELSVSPQEGEILICSEEKLPGIAIYQNEEETINSTTFGDEEFSIEDLGNDLPQVFDMSNLKKYVGKVDDYKVTEEDGVTSYACKLPKRFIRNLGASGPAAMLAANIKGVDAKFSVDSRGELAGVFIEITRENPMAKMMEMGGAMQLGGGNLDDLDPAMKAQIEAQMGGKDIVVEYRLKRETKASDRTQGVLKEMQSLLTQ